MGVEKLKSCLNENTKWERHRETGKLFFPIKSLDFGRQTTGRVKMHQSSCAWGILQSHKI
jgi:hypothetical protein